MTKDYCYIDKYQNRQGDVTKLFVPLKVNELDLLTNSDGVYIKNGLVHSDNPYHYTTDNQKEIQAKNGDYGCYILLICHKPDIRSSEIPVK